MHPLIQTKKPAKTGKKFFLVFSLFLMIFLSVSPNSAATVSSWFTLAAVPFWNAKNSTEKVLPSSGMFLRSKNSLVQENEDLRRQIDVLKRNLKGYDVVVQENIEFKKLFAGKKEGSTFAGILASTGNLPFDTFLLDSGGESGIKNNDLALADQNIVLGKIIETFPSSAKVKAFSFSGETTDVFLGPENIPAQLKGTGAGTYAAELPRELDVREGDAAILPGSEGFILAYVESKEENLTDSFQKLYLRTPVNVFQLKYVQVVHNVSGNE